jgi:hypothetical protein
MAAPLSPNSYTVVLPPGWIRVSLTGGVDDAVRDIADRMFRHVPRDAFTDRRREMEDLLRDMVRRARAGNGLDLYLPVEPMHGRLVSASFVVGGVMLPDEIDAIESVALLGNLAADGRIADVGGAPGVRTERIEAENPGQGGFAASRRVDYMVAVPGDDRRWITVTFSTPGGGAPDDVVADALVQLFDAIMTTFRWRNR